MKRIRKIAALALALLMLLSLTACGGFETRMVRAAQKMSGLKSLHADVVLTADVSLSLLGASSAVDAGITASVDHQTDPGRGKIDLDVTVMGTTQKILIYTEQEAEGHALYTSLDGGSSWEASHSEPGQVQLELNLGDQLQLIAGAASGFAETGRETVNGSTATVYAGVLPGELVRQAAQEAGLVEKIEEALDLELSEDVLDTVGDIPVTISIDDRSGMITRFTMDLSDTASRLLEEILTASVAGSGFGLFAGFGLEVRVSNVQLVTELSGFDSTSVEIPAAVKAAA